MNKCYKKLKDKLIKKSYWPRVRVRDNSKSKNKSVKTNNEYC